MRIPTFSFKNEAIWLVVFSFAPAVIGFVLFVLIWLLRSAF